MYFNFLRPCLNNVIFFLHQRTLFGLLMNDVMKNRECEDVQKTFLSLYMCITLNMTSNNIKIIKSEQKRSEQSANTEERMRRKLLTIENGLTVQQ